MFKRSKAQEKKGSEKREVLLVSFLKVARFVFAIIYNIRKKLYRKREVMLFSHRLPAVEV